MKKLLSITTLLTLSVSLSFAELHPSSRYVDIGTNVSARASQNLTGVTDLLVENLTINFTDIADSLDEDGLVFNAGLGTDFFIDINTGENKGFGFFFNTDGFATIGTGKGLWDFLGHGNRDTDLSSKVSVQGDLFLETGVKVKFKARRFGWTVKPTYYIPVFYIPKNVLKMDIETDDPAYMVHAYGSRDFTVYSSFDIGKAFDSDLKFQGAGEILSAFTDDITSVLSSGGFSVAVEAEYQLLNTFCAGVYAEIPVIAGTLDYKNTLEVDFDAYVSPILDNISEDKEIEHNVDYTYKLKDTEKKAYKVRKPLRLGFEGAWRPFGDWCTFRPILGIAARNPFGDDYSAENNLFVEYAFSTEITAFYVLKFNLESIYRNQVFTQRMGFGMNFRVFEFDVRVGSSGASFTKSWGISGLAAEVGLRLGF